jgi:multisubunit Na+/H+ antiporter MnhG subunit
MQRLVLLVCALVALAGAAHAQSRRAIECGLPAEEGQPPGERADFITLDGFASWLGKNAAAIEIAKVRQTAQAVQTLLISVQRPGRIEPADWERAFFEVLAYPSARSPSELRANDIVLGRVRPPRPSNENVREIVIEFASIERNWLPSRMEIVVLACVPEPLEDGRGLAKVRDLRAYGSQGFYFSSLWLSTAIGLGAVLLLYALIGLAAAGVHRRQYAFLRAREEKAGSRLSLLGFALRPTVLMQDSFGTCSLARFQVLLFTLVLTGVYAYVLARTGELSGLSNTVLALLGITLAGSTLARATGGPVVDTPNRLWLIGTGVLDATPRAPAWRDLIASDGEIDVTRVQAVAFSLFAAAALVINGTTNLAGFEIPQEINYLMGISQVVYIAGKALPQEAAKRLNEEIRAIRTAETRVLSDPTDAVAGKEFETARNAIGAALFDVFGERFDEVALRAMVPGRRLAREVV